MKERSRAVVRLIPPAMLLWAALPACSGRSAVLDLYPAVMYDKPRITRIEHQLADARAEGGRAVVTVTMLADPGLQASFAIYPGVAETVPMHEVEPGRYVGEHAFPEPGMGGTYSITGRIRHDRAGEAVLRDPEPLILFQEPLDD
ncbi:MAG TPA: hypothetical protein VJV23_02965 [Candidatus Polarisedimenticolia bacterium]|nr:hypothetical protein [Candidatus Polarisedimenticolia bacterium]